MNQHVLIDTLKPSDIRTDQEEYEALIDTLDRTQSTSKTCRVPVEALRNILFDHSKMYGRLFPQMSGAFAATYKETK
jgi:hypothetical protein